MNTLIPGAPLRSLSPTSIEYQRAQGASRAAKPARAARFTLDAPEHSGTIPGAIGDILPPGVALTSNLAVIFTLNQYTASSSSRGEKKQLCALTVGNGAGGAMTSKCAGSATCRWQAGGSLRNTSVGASTVLGAAVCM